MTENEKIDLKVEIITKAMQRYREVYKDLVDNAYLPIFAGQEAMTVVVNEFVDEYEDKLSAKDIAFVFFSLGGMSKMLEHPSKIQYDIDGFNKAIQEYDEKFGNFK